MSDRTYFHIATRPHAPRRAWHADAPVEFPHVALCGVVSGAKVAETADRVPSHGHLCGSCARVIAAQTDIEEPWADALADPATVAALNEGLADVAAGRVAPLPRDANDASDEGPA